MELRHLRCFSAVAEELHFARAAEKLHIEQSPLSRTIKELEEDLGAQLFVRTSRSTRLTRAGKMFLEHVPRIFAALQQARDSVKAAANGFHGQLRVALSDGIPPSRFSAFLALCRQEEPEIEIRLFEVPLAQQIKGLHEDLYDVGFARSDEVGDGLIAEAVWNDPLMVAVPARHPLLKHKRLPLEEVLRYPLALADPHVCEGCARQIERVLRQLDQEPLIAERVASIDLMMALVAAGFALGLAGASQIAASRELGVVGRPLAGRTPMLITYLLRADSEPSEALTHFIERISTLEPTATKKTARPLLTPGEVMQLPPDDAVVMVSSLAPIRAKKLRYYTDANFKRRVLLPPVLAVGHYTDAPPLRPNDWSGLSTPAVPAAPVAADLVSDDAGTADDGGPRRQPELSEVSEYSPEPKPADNDLALLDDDDLPLPLPRQFDPAMQRTARLASLDHDDGLQL